MSLQEKTCLVLSGGGTKGYEMLGSLKYLEKIGYLDKIETFYGTSIGSIISFFLAIGLRTQ